MDRFTRRARETSRPSTLALRSCRLQAPIPAAPPARRDADGRAAACSSNVWPARTASLPAAPRFIASRPTAIRGRSGATRRTSSTRWRSTRRPGRSRAPEITERSIALDSDHSYTRLLNVAPTQVTGFCAAPDGSIYAVTGNIGTIVSIGPELESSGTFESDVFDAGAFTYWGRLSDGAKGSGSIAFETRSGNLNRPQKNWSRLGEAERGTHRFSFGAIPAIPGDAVAARRSCMKSTSRIR